MSKLVKAFENGISITDFLCKLLKQVGYYAFNRFMAKHGFKIEYCLAIHKINAKKP
jgi:hypothetical protein